VSQQREQAEQRRKAEELRELAAFRLRWHGKATENLSAHTYQWLSAQQRKEVLDGLEAEIDKRQPLDEPRMGAIIARSLAALVEPLQAVHDAQEARQRVTNQVLRSLSIWTSEAEKVRATVAIEEALQRFDTFADVCKIRVVLEEAVAPVRLATEKRRAEEERKARKGSLIQRGLDEVFFFLAHLKSAGEIVEEALWDTEFMESLKETVRRRLEADLSGDEPLREVKELVHEVIEEVLEADEEDE
jgi:ferric iron reductase protein FhuF